MQRKIEGAGAPAVGTAYLKSLGGLASIRDVELELKLIDTSATVEDLYRVVDAYVLWLEDFERAADHLFALTAEEPAMDEYRRPLRLLRWILSDLRDGRDNGFTVLRQRSRGDRRDHPAVREFKARREETYKVLMIMGSRKADAIQAINELCTRETTVYGPSVSLLTSAQIAKFTASKPEQAVIAGAIELASNNMRSTFKGKLSLHSAPERLGYIAAVANYCLSGHLERLNWIGLKNSAAFK